MENYDNIQLPWQDWHVVRRLGCGSFGKVYEIEREFYGEKERAALKVIHLPQNASELEEDYNSGMSETEIFGKYEYIQKCMVEEYRQMLALKGHSNIVNCHDFAVRSHPNQPGCIIYIRMELLKSLEEVLNKGKFLESRIIQLGSDICQALEICEQKGIIHRDIKPGNIMISEFGDFKLGDFGLARTMEKTMSASLAGTDWYMAPEVAKKMKYGKNVDTYSLGLVLYWLLNHYRLPFVPLKERITPKDMNQAYRLRMQGKEIPEPAEGSQSLKKIVLKAISYDRDKRYQTAKEMLEDLQAVSVSDVSEHRKSDFSQETQEAKGIFGISFDYEEIQVGLWMRGETRFITRMPATYIKNELGDVMTGTRAQNYLKCHRGEEKEQYSVFEVIKSVENSSNVEVKEKAVETCCALMKELKKTFAQALYGNIQECVVAVPSASPIIAKSVYRAMQKAGFQVKRIFDTPIACAISKAYRMKETQKFMVCAVAGGEQQYVTSVYESGVLEIIESIHSLSEYDQTEKNPPSLKYYIGDHACCRNCNNTVNYEELSTVAADGAAIQGAILGGYLERSFLLLDVVSFGAGIEIVDEMDRPFCPLIWMIEEQESIPAKSRVVPICINSGLKGKKLRLYVRNTGTKETARMVREWNLENLCKESAEALTRLEATLDIHNMYGYLSMTIEIRKTETQEKITTLDFYKDDQRNISNLSAADFYVPEEIMENVCTEEKNFQKNVEMLLHVYENRGIVQGICLIAKKSAEIFAEYRRADTAVQTDKFIEQVLVIADNLEYGLKETVKEKAMEEDWHLCYAGRSVLYPFYLTIRDTLFQLGLTPIEAEGACFDPYIHYAMLTEKMEGVEEGIITEEIQKGYFKEKRLYRPARVKVAE